MIYTQSQANEQLKPFGLYIVGVDEMGRFGTEYYIRKVNVAFDKWYEQSDRKLSLNATFELAMRIGNNAN
jgi:hypothetical protein